MVNIENDIIGKKCNCVSYIKSKIVGPFSFSNKRFTKENQCDDYMDLKAQIHWLKTRQCFGECTFWWQFTISAAAAEGKILSFSRWCRESTLPVHKTKTQNFQTVSFPFPFKAVEAKNSMVHTIFTDHGWEAEVSVVKGPVNEKLPPLDENQSSKSPRKHRPTILSYKTPFSSWNPSSCVPTSLQSFRSFLSSLFSEAFIYSQLGLWADKMGPFRGLKWLIF